MKKNWVISFCIITSSILYAGCLILFKINPFNDFKALLIGGNINFFSLISPFIFITVLYYAIILPKTLIKSLPKKKKKIFNKNINNIGFSKQNIPNNSPQVPVLGNFNPDDYLEYEDPEQLHRLSKVVKVQKDETLDSDYTSINYHNPIEERTRELEVTRKGYISSIEQQNPVNATTNVSKNQAKVMTLLPEEKALEPEMMSIIGEINPGKEKPLVEVDSTQSFNSRLIDYTEKITQAENQKLEELIIENDELISDIDALSVVEGLEDGNSLFIDKEIMNRKKQTFSMLDSLNEAVDLDSIIGGKTE
ncbi:hypothetical protein [Pedobacter nutrimenti]|uniref:hypothetical protein n=1 Tax=Pedobacter nutrimenti TaxID=1241337 RepID=UPI000DA1FD40|nr:hypothetical protein [Pedobacter nutrimenti]